MDRHAYWRQSRASGWKRPIWPDEVREIYGDKSKGFPVDFTEWQILVKLPVVHLVDRVAFHLAELPARCQSVTIETSVDSLDGSDGVWSPFTWNSGVSTQAAAIIECGGVEVRWVRLRLDSGGVGAFRFFQIEGNPGVAPIEFCDEAGAPYRRIQLNDLPLGDSGRMPFWIRNNTGIPIDARVNVVMAPESPQTRCWLVTASDQYAKSIEIPKIMPGRKRGPFYVVVEPAVGDAPGLVRAHLRLGGRKSPKDRDV